MRFRDYIPAKLLLLLFSITIVVFSSCIQDKNPLDPGVCPTYVRIYAMLQSQTSTRSSDPTNWSTSLGNEDETKISSIRVFAIRDEDKGVEKNQLFIPGASNIDEQLSEVVAGSDEKVYSMQMLILTGHYEFILIANEDSSWGLGSSEIKTKDDLLLRAQEIQNIENKIITPHDLSRSAGIPMVGSEHFDISYAQGISYPGSPQDITPRVNLERTLAKVEVTFTNKKGTDIYPMGSVESINSNIMTAYQHYNLLPDMTNSVSLPDLSNPEDGKNKFVLKVDLPSASESMNEWTTAPYVYYMAERPGDMKDALMLHVNVKKKSNPSYTPFDIRFFSKDENDYNIRRNYYYKVRCIVRPKPILEIMAFSGYWTAREFRILIPYPNYDLVLTDYDKTKKSDNHRPDADVASMKSGYEVQMFTNRSSEDVAYNVGCTLVSAVSGVSFGNSRDNQVSLKPGQVHDVQTISVNGTSSLSEGTVLFYIIENLPKGHKVEVDKLKTDPSTGKRMYIVRDSSGVETGYYWYTISK